MAGPPSPRLARASTRLAADPLRSEGACRRPLPRLSSSETPAKDYNRKLRGLLHAGCICSEYTAASPPKVVMHSSQSLQYRSDFERSGYHANMANFRSLHM